MKKIKITLTSGNVIEKNVLTAFKGTYGDYIVLDNESVGSMGLPVILISKIQDNRLLTINDANEWNAIKDNLRNIIAGNQIVKTEVKDEYTGEDVYYKQLTLPVASFDTLKNTFDDNDGDSGNNVNPIQGAPVGPNVSLDVSEATVEPTAQVMPTNVNPESVAPEQVIQTPVAPMPDVSSVGPMEPNVVNVPNPSAAPTMAEMPVAPDNSMQQAINPTTSNETFGQPIPSQTLNNEMPEAPVMPPLNEMANNPVTPEAVVEPVPTPEEHESIDIAADKEAFLKACENMFDALVAKFNK